MKDESSTPVKRGPWTTLSSREVYQNPWIRVREDQVLRPGGGEGIYGVVESRAATGVVALTETGEIYLVGQYRYPTERYSWEIIEGGADPGELPLVAAQRELREEAGLSAERWETLCEEIQLSNCHSSELAYLYLARDLEEVGITYSDPTEELSVRTLPLSEAHEMVLRGEISDALSMIAIALTWQKYGMGLVRDKKL